MNYPEVAGTARQGTPTTSLACLSLTADGVLGLLGALDRRKLNLSELISCISSEVIISISDLHYIATSIPILGLKYKSH